MFYFFFRLVVWPPPHSDLVRPFAFSPPVFRDGHFISFILSSFSSFLPIGGR